MSQKVSFMSSLNMPLGEESSQKKHSRYDYTFAKYEYGERTSPIRFSSSEFDDS